MKNIKYTRLPLRVKTRSSSFQPSNNMYYIMDFRYKHPLPIFIYLFVFANRKNLDELSHLNSLELDHASKLIEC